MAAFKTGFKGTIRISGRDLGIIYPHTRMTKLVFMIRLSLMHRNGILKVRGGPV